jgi:hypothetical protein
VVGAAAGVVGAVADAAKGVEHLVKESATGQ